MGVYLVSFIDNQYSVAASLSRVLFKQKRITIYNDKQRLITDLFCVDHS